MKTYYLHHNQNGRVLPFGARDNSDAQEIAGALLRRMTVDKGGVLYTKTRDKRYTVQNFTSDGGITVNGVHAA